jgi:hypothetical protein
MNKFLFLLFSVLTLQLAVANDIDLKSAIKDFATTDKKPSVDYSASCATCAHLDKTHSKSSLYSKSNSTKLSLTVLTQKEAAALFQEFASNPEIPFGYPLDGCYARAHKMVMLMEKKGIISGKAWVTGDILVDTSMGVAEWGYHVAPVVLVQEKNGPAPYVIDPSLSNSIIPFSEWKAKMLTKKGSEVEDEYYTNRFAFGPSDKNANLEHFSPSDTQVTEDTNRSNLELQKPI